MNPITLKTTNRGLAGSYINGIIWAVSLLIISTALSFNMVRIFNNHNVSSFGEFNSLWRTSGGEQFAVFGGVVFMVVTGIAVMIITACLVEQRLYGHRTFHVLTKHPENGWCLERYTFGFRGSRDLDTTQFNRIIGIDVHQGSWDRDRNVGSIRLTLVTFTSGDSETRVFDIEGIEDLYSRAQEIRDTFGGHDGLLVSAKLDELNGED